MRVSLYKFFAMLDGKSVFCANEVRQSTLFDVPRSHSGEDLFSSALHSYEIEKADIELLSAYFSWGFDPSLLCGSARVLFEISSSAFDIVLHAWLSELPVYTEAAAFGKKIISKEGSAQNIINDRTDADTRIVLDAAAKVHREVHRMMGLLRFLPNENGEFIARCAPDHLILPSLSGYFTSRFGETPWSIIDEKRSLCLRRKCGEKAKTVFLASEEYAVNSSDEWENLWKHYHKTINNEDRNNPGLQKQFMPKRYWKYLPET
ncbi:MAG: TIGR03915 family putative DNA repair protein [Treponema sp.]|nr:TIGR03915 family putative DNA repair protein [Treponema sp.]